MTAEWLLKRAQVLDDVARMVRVVDCVEYRILRGVAEELRAQAALLTTMEGIA